MVSVDFDIALCRTRHVPVSTEAMHREARKAKDDAEG